MAEQTKAIARDADQKGRGGYAGATAQPGRWSGDGRDYDG